MTIRITKEDSIRIKIMALAKYTPQEIALKYPQYNVDQIRNHINNKYGDEVKIVKDNSRGNVKLLSFLKEIFPNTKIETEYSIGQSLRLDCYVGHPYNLGFEYDGVQHSKSVDHFGGDDQYIKNRENDQLKENICKGRGINLVRISHTEAFTKDVLLFKIDAIGYGTGILRDEFKTNKEKKKERDAKTAIKAREYRRERNEKNKSRVSGNKEAQKLKAREIRRAQYQKSKAWAAARRNKV